MNTAAMARTVDTPTPAEPVVLLTVPLHPAAKIAHKTKSAKNRPQDTVKNRLQDEPKNRPDIINPVSLCGVIDEGELKALLGVKKQTAWCSRVRTVGLLRLIDFICRNLKNGRISISADLAHQYISKLRNSKGGTMITEPLLLLCAIGTLKRVRPAVFSHIKTSAVYCFTDCYRKKRIRFEVVLPPKHSSKLKLVPERRERRLSRRYPFRKQLLADLAAVSFPASARPLIANGFRSEGRDNLERLVTAIDLQHHSVNVSVRGQITTSIGSCPRELQPLLLLDGEPTVSCDIANAHWNFLPLILAKRLDYVSGSPGRQDYINEGWREHNQLVVLLSDGDFYRTWCADRQDDDERDGKKTILNILLNERNEVCERNILFRRFRTEFPITFGILADIKRNDHRALAKQLHRFTADAIAAALLEVQREGIAAIPHVDALICQEKNRERVCEAIGRQVFQATGVCCIVGGIRYSPLTEEERQALTFDEAEPSDDGMSYDEWEALRTVKCVAALKLMRRCPSLFSPFALAACRSI